LRIGQRDWCGDRGTSGIGARLRPAAESAARQRFSVQQLPSVASLLRYGRNRQPGNLADSSCSSLIQTDRHLEHYLKSVD